MRPALPIKLLLNLTEFHALYGVSGAGFCAYVAVYALGVVYVREVVLNLYCIGRADILALLAAYAGSLAFLDGCRTLVLVAACNYCGGSCGNKTDNEVRTCLCA